MRSPVLPESTPHNRIAWTRSLVDQVASFYITVRRRKNTSLCIYPSRRARYLADDIGEHDVVVDRVLDHLAPLGVLAEPHVVALERVGDAARVRLLAIPEEKAGRHFFAHAVAAYLVEAQSVPVALRKRKMMIIFFFPPQRHG